MEAFNYIKYTRNGRFTIEAAQLQNIITIQLEMRHRTYGVFNITGDHLPTLVTRYANWLNHKIKTRSGSPEDASTEGSTERVFYFSHTSKNL